MSRLKYKTNTNWMLRKPGRKVLDDWGNFTYEGLIAVDAYGQRYDSRKPWLRDNPKYDRYFYGGDRP